MERSTSRRLRFVRRAPALATALVLLMATFAGAVHGNNGNNLFELGLEQQADILGDGNDNNGPDWEDIFEAVRDENGVQTDVVVEDLFGGSTAGFIVDELAPGSGTDDTTFGGAGGSNKNPDPLGDEDCASRNPELTGSDCNTWHWDGGNNPAKDDLSNVYAYATFNPAGHLIIYSGFERLDPSGDSHVDIEFFKDQIGLDEKKPCNDPGKDVTPCNFTGVRSVGDIIVSMDFVVGGSIGSVSIHEWNGTTYEQIGLLGGEGCNDPPPPGQSGPPADSICAYNNGGNINGGSWDNFDNHANVITELEQNAFTEFGVDVTALEDSTPCISTFMGKTRSSASFTAELKDFAGPTSFPVCGAQIKIEPDDVNEVGDPHTFRVTVEKKIGPNKSPAPSDTHATVTLTAGGGAVPVVDAAASTCDDPGGNLDANGQCTITFTSDTAGTVTGHASASVSFGGETFNVATNGQGGNSRDAVKRFVDAWITISPSDVNEVGQNHTFTVTAKQDTGSGFVNVPDGTKPTVTLADAGGAVSNISSNTCTTPGTVNGVCTVTFTSNSAGTVTGHASVTLNMTFTEGSISVTRSTDGVLPNSPDAVKRFVDAWITIAPDDTNSVGEDHTFTVTAKQDIGDASGFQPVPDGTKPTVTLTDTLGAVHSISSNTCADPGTSGGTGTCSITFTSNTAGTVTGHASVTLPMTFTEGSISVTRATDGTGKNSGDAVKRFVSGSIAWTKKDNAGRLQGGATFQVCRTENLNSSTTPDSFVDITDVCFDVTDNSLPDTDTDAGEFKVEGLRLGKYEVTETVAPPGFVLDSKVENVTLDLSDLPASANKTIAQAWVNQRPILKITGFGYTNQPQGSPSDGVLKGTTVYTVKVKNFGGASTNLSNSSLAVTVSAGSISCTGGNTLALTGSLAPGAELTFTLTCPYDLPDGTVVTADLNVKYTTNTLERVASGSPAKIQYTVQGD